MASCGDSSANIAAPPPTAPTPSAGFDPPIVRLAPTGADPRQLIVAVGGQVTFINNDTQPHDIAGGTDPANPDCREIDAVGFLSPGQSRQTARCQSRAPVTTTITATMLQCSRADSSSAELNRARSRASPSILTVGREILVWSANTHLQFFGLSRCHDATMAFGRRPSTFSLGDIPVIVERVRSNWRRGPSRSAARR